MILHTSTISVSGQNLSLVVILQVIFLFYFSSFSFAHPLSITALEEPENLAKDIISFTESCVDFPSVSLKNEL